MTARLHSQDFPRRQQGALESCRVEVDSWFRKVNWTVGCGDGLVEGESGGRATCGEMLSVAQIIVAGGDVMAIGLRKGGACQGHSKARTKGSGSHREGG